MVCYDKEATKTYHDQCWMQGCSLQMTPTCAQHQHY